MLGIGLYGLTYLYPVYLAQMRGYDALMIGETMFVSGLAMFLSAPVAGRLRPRFDPRFMLIVGFLLFALGTWQMTFLTKDWDFWELFWPQIFRGVGLMFAIVPVTNIALGTLPPERVKNASGLFNLTRNLGGAVGLAAHQHHAQRPHGPASRAAARSGELVARSRRPRRLRQLTARFHEFGSDAQAMALKQMWLHGAPAGGGDELCRCVSDADGAVVALAALRHHHEEAGRACRRSGRALIVQRWKGAMPCRYKRCSESSVAFGFVAWGIVTASMIWPELRGAAAR